jgi:hypothetical protein|tara:strand:- start:317 stop:1120 length:804 start_codon:yes stop_codon:yes gene_type:complete
MLSLQLINHKSIKMKKIFLLFFPALVIFGCAEWKPTSETIEWPDTLPNFEVIFLLPKEEKTSEFIEKIKLHDSKFHNKVGEAKTSLRYISAGMKSGYYAWAEGPMQYSYVDSKGEIEGHQEDWDRNIAPLIKDEGGANYYSLATPISYTNDNLNYDANILEVVGFKISDKKGSQEKVNQTLYRWKKAFEKGDSSQEFRIFYPNLKDESEADIYIVWPHENMNSIETWSFEVNKYIDEVYGEGASKEQWDTWNRLTKVTEGSYRTLVK